MYRLLLLAVCLLIGVADAQQQPGVTLMIREKSGFLGMGPAQHIIVSLDNEPGQYPLTCANVNAGTYYFFLVKSAGDWVPDEDFVKEDLPKLSIGQREQKYLIAWLGELNTADSSVLVGFPKDLHLHEPMVVQYQIDDELQEEPLSVPVELWPGYDKFTDLQRQVAAAGTPEQAISVYEAILGDAALEIFPGRAETMNERTAAFRRYLAERTRRIENIRQDSATPLKDRIQQLDAVTPELSFIAEGLVKPSLGIRPDNPDVAAVLQESDGTVKGARMLRDSLQKALEEENTKWIIDGGATGRSGFVYQYVIEALAYAFSSLDFSDTTGAAFTPDLPAEQRERLGKQKLVESYEAFLRICAERRRLGLSLFPPLFLANLQRDSSVFSLPFHDMLFAVQEYFAGRLESARRAVFAVFRTCYEPVFNERFDNMRIMIEIRTGRQSEAALGVVQEAVAAERSGNLDGAGETYRQAAAVASDFAYAAFMLGRYYDRMNDPVRALTFLQRAYELDTLYLSAYREAAQLFRKGGTFKPMIDVLTKAITHGNTYWETHYTLGLAYVGDGNLQAAVEQFQLARAINPRSYDTNIQLGLAYQALADYQKARDHYNNAINIDPLRQTAVDLLTKLNELQRAPRE